MTTTTENPTAQSVTALRKAGRLREAYQQARALCAADPDNSWNQRAMAWVYADLLKDAATQADPARLLSGLRQVATLPMADDETLWREQVLWPVVKFLLRVPADELSLSDLAGLVAGVRPFLNPAPSLVRSVWWKALLRHKEARLDWLGLLADGGWGAFRPDDYAPETVAETSERKRPTPTPGPLVERVCVAAARQLLATVPVLESAVRPVADRFSALVAQYPDWTLLPYYQAQLLLAIGQDEEAIRIYLPFARRKNREFWVWAGLATMQGDHADAALACYAMALLQQTPDAFLVKVRQQTARLLISLGLWPEARVELEKLVASRQNEGWKIPAEVTAWLNDDQYTQLNGAILPRTWVEVYRPIAQSLLWADVPEQPALVVGVDNERQTVRFVIDVHTEGAFRYPTYGCCPVVGDVLLLRVSTTQAGENTHLRVQTARVGQYETPRVALKVVTGPLRLHERGFGFVQDALVPAEVIARLGLVAGEPVALAAYEALDVRKQKKGWKVFDRADNSLS